jgi:hypothetical protein
MPHAAVFLEAPVFGFAVGALYVVAVAVLRRRRDR